jgi:hypothetical protein
MFESLLNSTQQRRIFCFVRLTTVATFPKKSKGYRADDVNCLPNHKAHERR